MKRVKGAMLASVLTVAAAGCGQQHSSDAFAPVQADVAARLGARVEWNQHGAEDRAVEQRARALLAKPLTPDAAVQIALLNNRNLQATFEELGIAQADLVQAGLLANPVFDLSVRFPDRSPSKTYLDIAAAENFLNVFLIPARKKIAGAEFDAARARVTQEVIALASQTRQHFYACQAARQLTELRQRISDASNASLDAATRLRQAGNITELDYYGERAQAARSAIELASAQADEADAREQLDTDLGAWGDAVSWTIVDRLPDPPATEVAPGGLEALAIQQRQDLAALKNDLLAQARMYGVTVDTRFFADADLGAEFERETDGQWRIGPTLQIPLPLFDRGQAAIPRAAAVLRQARDRYLALAVQIRSEVRQARTRMLSSRAQVEFYKGEVLPTQQRYLEQTQLNYNGMFASVFQLLQAKRDEIDVGARYVEALKMYWISRAQLERAVGGRLPEGGDARPTTQPAVTRSLAPLASP